MAVINVASFGASALAADNTAAIAAAVAAAQPDDQITGTPGALYTCREATDIAALTVNKRLHWYGDWGMAMANDEAMDADPAYNHHATLYLNSGASGSTFRGVRFEGNKDGAGGPTEYFDEAFTPSPLEHHRAVFCNAVTDILFEDVTVKNYTGDAVQLYNSCERYVFRRCLMEWCGRDHITLSPFEDLTPVRDVLIEDCTLRGASNQQVDNEHGCAHRIIVRRNHLECADNLRSIGLVLAGSGTDINAPSTGWEIYDNTMVGGMRFTWTSSSIVRNNTFLNARQTSSIEMERGQSNNKIIGNVITQTQTTTNNLAAVYINGTVGGGASNIEVLNNIATLSYRSSFGVRADGAISVLVMGNVMVAPGLTQAGFFGTRARCTVAARPMTSYRVINNAFYGFGQAGIGVRGSVGGETLDYAEIRGNVIGGCATGMSLDDGLGTLKSALVYGNTYGSTVSSQVADVPGGASMVYSLQNVPGPSGVRHKSLPTSV